MTYTVESVVYSDSHSLTETMMHAMNGDPHYSKLLKGATIEEIIADTRLRTRYNLSSRRNVLRHQKVVHTETGDLVGYARWELPDTAEHHSAWLDAQTPAPTETQQTEFKSQYDQTMTAGRRNIFNFEMGDYIGPALGKPYNELFNSGGPYMDYIVCHPGYQRTGVASLLLASGESEAQKLGLKIFAMTSPHPASTPFYESRGFENLHTVTLDETRWGGNTPHVTSFLAKGFKK